MTTASACSNGNSTETGLPPLSRNPRRTASPASSTSQVVRRALTILRDCGFACAVKMASSRGLISEHGLDLEVLLEAEHAVLAAVAGLLVAAERHVAVHRRAVEVDAAGAQLPGDPAR